MRGGFARIIQKFLGGAGMVVAEELVCPANVITIHRLGTIRI